MCWFVFDQNNGDAYDKKIELDGVKRIENCGGGQGREYSSKEVNERQWRRRSSLATLSGANFFLTLL